MPKGETVIDTSMIDIDADADDVIMEDDLPVIASNDDKDVINEDADEIAQLPKGAVELDDGSVLVTLDRPVVLNLKSQSRGVRQETTKDVRFYRLTGAHLTQITNSGEKSREVTAFALSARMNMAKMKGLFDRMDAADIGRCGQVLEYFLGSGRKTGRT